MAGTIKLDGTTFLTKDSSNNFTLDVGSGGSISQGTIGSNVTFPAGHIINVTSLTRTSTDSHTTSTPKEITGLTHTISNPKSGSKFLLTGVINLSWDTGTSKAGFFITRTDADGEVTIARGDQNGTNRLRFTNYFYINHGNYSPIPLAFNFLDSPNTSSSVVYKFKFSSMDNTGTIYLNRSETWNDATNYGTTISTTTIFEVAQ